MHSLRKELLAPRQHEKAHDPDARKSKLSKTRSCKQNSSVQFDFALELTNQIKHISTISFSDWPIPVLGKILPWNFVYGIGSRALGLGACLNK